MLGTDVAADDDDDDDDAAAAVVVVVVVVVEAGVDGDDPPISNGFGATVAEEIGVEEAGFKTCPECGLYTDDMAAAGTALPFAGDCTCAPACGDVSRGSIGGPTYAGGLRGCISDTCGDRVV